MTARDLNLMRVFFFVVGFMTGILAYRAVAFITPVIPHAQLLHNACPRKRRRRLEVVHRAGSAAVKKDLGRRPCQKRCFRLMPLRSQRTAIS